jgi:hypothetical protein
MMKRMMFLAAGVIASLAFTASSQAGPTYLYDVTSTVVVDTGTTTTATATFDGPITSYEGLLPGTSPALGTVVGALGAGADQVTFTFTSVGPGDYKLNFEVNSTAPTLHFLGYNIGSTGQGGGNGYVTAVPEPGSMALLGIGMTSFLAFRRFFKRNPVA